jgi:peptidoglycan/xylan/chitin deacetylase (PgdA/CDA1 family)
MKFNGLKNMMVVWLCMLYAAVQSADYKATCTIDRTTVFPRVPYQELTLRLPIGDATSADVLVDGQAIASRIDETKKMLIITTKGSAIEAHVHGASSQTQIGAFNKAVLRDDKKWAWSHGFDDNVGYSHYATEVFKKYGWTGTLFMMGKYILPDSGLTWACAAPDVRRLFKEGWAIGNHGYQHSTCDNCTQQELFDEIKLCQDAIRSILKPVDSTYMPVAFASPAFTHNYNATVRDIRNNHPEVGTMWVEGAGDNANSGWRLDEGATELPWRWVWAADSNKVVPRSGALWQWGHPDYADKPNEFQWAIDSMIYYSDETHHYWLNSLEHGVDQFVTDGNIDNCNRDVFGFVPWLYNKCGPGGDNTVWVAPSEKVYSYYITQLTAKLTATTVSAFSTSTVNRASAHAKRVFVTSYSKSASTSRRLVYRAAYDLRGNQIKGDQDAMPGICIMKR